MTTEDVTRLLRQPWKHYGGSRLQTARPTVDSDFNEDAIADDEDLRRATLAIVGPRAQVDGGFAPDLKVGETVMAKLVRFGAFFEAYVLDFDLQPGVVFMGGLRFEQPALESIVFQREYLQMGPATAPRAAVGVHRQLLVLRGWEQPVSAIEDAELLESALGGADAGLRQRTMRRVEVHAVQGQTCAEAFAEVVQEISEGTDLTYDPDTCELRSNVRLQMGFYAPPVDDDCPACIPSLRGRYLGRENHTIRVMLATPSSYVWAFDDAAPLYRVRMVVDGNGGAQLQMLTPPKDSYHHPHTGTVVELLPWSVLLENGQPQGGKIVGENVHDEKLASRVGFFAEVDQPYDAASRNLHVQLAPGTLHELGVFVGKDPAKASSKALQNLKSNANPIADTVALRWDDQHPHASQLNAGSDQVDGFEAFVFMRVWHRKAEDEGLAIPTTAGRPLGATGLVPTFFGSGRAGDYWILAVRPSAPDEIVPYELTRSGGVTPLGPREYLTPVTLLTWSSPTGFVHELVGRHDCIPRLPALTERGCVTFVVGPDGLGDFESIQAAVQALPSNGGLIRVLPGDYVEEVRIEGRSDVTVCGCGPDSRIVSPLRPAAEALVTVTLDAGHGNVVLRDLAVSARGQAGVDLTGETLVCQRLSVRTERGEQTPVQSAIRVLDGRDVRVERCTLVQDGSPTDHATVYVESPGLGVTIEDNTVAVDRRTDAFGGIHVAGGSSDVEIRANRIGRGRGHGVTLGSVTFRSASGRMLARLGAGHGQSETVDPFVLTGTIAPIVVDGETFFPDPDDAIQNVTIADNEIVDVGGSGIASLALEVEHGGDAMAPPLCLRRRTFVVQGMTIRDNRIADGALSRVTEGARAVLGGVVLSDVLDSAITSNRIERFGRGTGHPACGIFVGAAQRLQVTSNALRDNGGRGVRGGPGFDGGIVMVPPGTLQGGWRRWFEARLDALVIRDNVVEQRTGSAMALLVAGACNVTRNFLSGSSAGLAPLGPASAWILNVGRPPESVDLDPGAPSPERWIQPEGTGAYLQGTAQRMPGFGGATIFSHNQVTTFPGAASSQRDDAVGVRLVSMDSVVMMSNQLAARAGPQAYMAHAMVLAPTIDVAHNRVAETLEATQISLLSAATLLTASTTNVLTHCHVAFGGANHGNPDYFNEDDNLVWLDLRDGGCRAAAKVAQSTIAKTLESLFGTTRFFSSYEAP